MNFRSTRGLETSIRGTEAIIKGIALDGGLYVPESFPKVYKMIRDKNITNYEDIAVEVINQYFTDIGSDSIRKVVQKAYEGRFKVLINNGFLELYNGPTCAFKDAGLLFLPQIMKESKKIEQIDDEIVILAATSGDTGKAAVEGFKDIEGFKVMVYYPKDGVSEIQRKQMVTSEGNNIKLIAIEGNFDNAQNGVKEIFNDNNLKEKLKGEGIRLSSANSINIGRLIPQIVYYFYGYISLINNGEIEDGEEINVVVPTGNFGNILASYYAKQMGLPIHKFICASNENNVLTDFFNSGVYDRRRELILTESPSMDILISSNLERLLYEASGRDSKEIVKLMSSLQEKGIYEINSDMKEFLKEFYGNYATDNEVHDEIRRIYLKDNYLIDTHTAVGSVVNNKYKEETDDNRYSLIASTANPYKFPRSVCNSLGIDISSKDDFEVLRELYSKTLKEIPKSLKDLNTKEELHKDVCRKENMRKVLLDYIKNEK